MLKIEFYSVADNAPVTQLKLEPVVVVGSINRGETLLDFMLVLWDTLYYLRTFDVYLWRLLFTIQ